MPFLLFMPSYNQARFITEAVASVLAQDDGDWELWIVDNSTDETPQVMAAFTDPRVKFHHIPERMDPGACLNWMLARAEGRDFSYIHTDNNLAPGYVRAMRGALAAHPLALAYCDMRHINEAGQRTHFDRRGFFDLPRLMSMSPLGVPFAATTELAGVLGGFSCDDVADDVLFCTRAFGLGPWTYLRQPLVDYRHHARSRTNQHGGGDELTRTVVRTLAKARPELEARGLMPLAAMRERLAEIGEDLRAMAEAITFELRRFGVGRWDSDDYFDDLWQAGLIRLPGFSRWEGPPRIRSCLRTARGGVLNPALMLGLRWYIQQRMNYVFYPRTDEFRRTLLGLARSEIGDGARTLVAGSSDAMTLWACRFLERDLGWKVVLTRPSPPRLPWTQAGDGRVADSNVWIDLSHRANGAHGAGGAEREGGGVAKRPTSLVW